MATWQKGTLKLSCKVYDLFINGTRIKRIYGNKAFKIAEKTSGGMFGGRRVELVDIETGEIVLQIERGDL